jgi:hypothetical protein
LSRRGWPGHRRAEATPFSERLCPAMTNETTEQAVQIISSEMAGLLHKPLNLLCAAGSPFPHHKALILRLN